MSNAGLQNQLSESLFATISAISNNTVSKSANDKTIECEIARIQDASKGIYTVKYTDNKFTAIASNGLTYAVGDSVYVLVPEGNFSKTKIILGHTKAVRFQYQQGENQGGGTTETKEIIIQNKTYYDEITENLFVNIGDVELCTYHTEEKEVSYDNHYLSDIIKNYEIFVLKAKFKTKIIDIAQRARGNYGLKVCIPAIDLDGEEFVVEKILDINKMDGNAYKFEDFTTQQLYFNFHGALINPEKPIIISAFVKNFIQSSDNQIPADIFIKDIEFKAVNALTSEDLQGNYLNIEVTESEYFLDGKYDNDKILTPKLRVNGEYVDIKDYECYWFKEDGAITADHSDYNTRGGAGWRFLNAKTPTGETEEDGTPIYTYDLSTYNYVVKKTDIITAARYKCVLVNSSMQVHSIVTITNLSSGITYSLSTPTGFTTFVKGVGTVNLIAKLHYTTSTENTTFNYVFTRYNKDGEYIDNNFYKIDEWDTVDGYDRITKINFPVGSIEEFNIVKCEFIKTRTQDNEIINESIGFATINLTTGSKVFDYSLSLVNSHYFYKYDADGNAPLSTVANFKGSYESKIDEILPIKAKILKYTGDELSSSEYNSVMMTWSFPKDSMMDLVGYDLESLEQDDRYYYVKGKGIIELSYSIKEAFNENYNDNTILVTALYDETVLRGNTDFTFRKDGSSGTNGSKYSIVIKHEITDEDGIDRWYAYGDKGKGGIPQKLRAIYANDSWKRYLNKELVAFGSPKFKVEVYKNGKLIENNSEEENSYEVNWEMYDSLCTNPFFEISEEGILAISQNWTNAEDVSVNIVKASVKVTENSDKATGLEEYVYGFYPIDIIRLDSAQKFIPEIIGGFNDVVYDSDGTNPHYNADDAFSINIIDGLNNYFTCDWTSSYNIDEENTENINSFSKKFSPNSNWFNGDSSNYIKAVLTQTAEEQNQVNAAAAELANQVTSLTNKINYLNNEKNYLQTLLDNFSYDAFVNELELCNNYLIYRGKYLSILFELVDILNQIKNKDESLDYSTQKAYLENIIYDIYNVVDSSYIEEFNTTLNSQGINNSEILSLINTFNAKLADVHNAFNNLINYTDLNSELTIYNKIVSDLKNIPTSMTDLCSAHDGDIANQEFINIQNQIDIYVKYFEDITKGYTKAWIIENILKPIESLLAPYRDANYISTKYIEPEKNLQSQLATAREQVAAADQTYFNYAIVIKPILFLLNRYGLASINNWDGGKFYVDENGEYIFAPQMGAGKKVEGKFTGILMGVRGRVDENEDIGLFGYSEGAQSFFLNSEDGSAIFGLPGEGQIIIDPMTELD